jgi:hypothetical protein
MTNDNPPKIIKHTKHLVSLSGIIYRTPMGKNPGLPGHCYDNRSLFAAPVESNPLELYHDVL